MWAPWRVASLVAVASGIVSSLTLLKHDLLFALAFGLVFAVQICFLTRLVSWVSRRSLLPPRFALSLVGVIALAAFISSSSIETHAVIYAASVAEAQEAFAVRTMLIASAPYAIAIVATLVIYRAFGSRASAWRTMARDEHGG